MFGTFSNWRSIYPRASVHLGQSLVAVEGRNLDGNDDFCELLPKSIGEHATAHGYPRNPDTLCAILGPEFR
jgi:hypothetical protein